MWNRLLYFLLDKLTKVSDALKFLVVEFKLDKNDDIHPVFPFFIYRVSIESWFITNKNNYHLHSFRMIFLINIYTKWFEGNGSCREDKISCNVKGSISKHEILHRKGTPSPWTFPFQSSMPNIKYCHHPVWKLLCISSFN